MPDELPTVSTVFVQGFLDVVRKRGFDPKDILTEARIETARFDSPDGRIDGVELQRLLSAIMREMNDLYMGFTKERYKPVVNSAVLKMAAANNKSLGEITRASIEYRESVRDDVHYSFDIDKKNHKFCLSLSDFDLHKGVDPHLFYWLRLSTIYSYESWLIGRRIKLNRVNFASDKPAGDGAHLKLFNCEVNFKQQNNAVYYDSKYLSYPIVRSEAEIIQNVHEGTAIEDWLEVPGSDLSVARQVEKAIENLQKEEIFHPTIDVVAKRLRVNPRSLRNQLARENENFQQIKAKVRQEVAIKKLISTALPVSTVALELGFSEPGDFSRNFKRWTGYSPSEYRAKFAKT